jgi:hypothetical protein
MRTRRPRPHCPALRFTAPLGTQRWAPPPTVLARIACMLRGDVTVELVHRDKLAKLWRETHGAEPLPAGRYAFRAWARGSNIHIVVDETETPQSVVWLLLHELAHTEVSRSRMLQHAFRSAPRDPAYMTSDAAHEAAPEEQLANRVADSFARQVGSRPGLHRIWWRRRVDRLGDATFGFALDNNACHRFADYVSRYHEVDAEELTAMHSLANTVGKPGGSARSRANSQAVLDQCDIALADALRADADDRGITPAAHRRAWRKARAAGIS